MWCISSDWNTSKTRSKAITGTWWITLIFDIFQHAVWLRPDTNHYSRGIWRKPCTAWKRLISFLSWAPFDHFHHGNLCAGQHRHGTCYRYNGEGKDRIYSDRGQPENKRLYHPPGNEGQNRDSIPAGRIYEILEQSRQLIYNTNLFFRSTGDPRIGWRLEY